MARLLYTLVKVPLDADIDDNDTTVTFTAPLREFGEDNIATIAAPDTLTLRCGMEIMHVTAYTSGALSATVARGQEGSTATAHSEGDILRHVATDLDLGGGGDVESVNTQTGAVVLDAGDIGITDTGAYFTGTDVEAALQELAAGGGGGAVEIEDWTDLGNLGSTETITGAANIVRRRKGTLDQACTVTIALTANQQAAVILAQDATGGRAVTFSGVDTWATSDGLAPDTSGGAANEVDRFHFEDVAGTTFGYWITEPPAAGGGGSGGELLAQVTYDPAANTTYTTTDSTVTDLDSTNLAVTFTAPASGKVNVVLHAAVEAAAANKCFWALREGTTTVGRRFVWRAANSTPYAAIVATLPITGLTPSSSYTYKWAAASEDTNDMYTMGGGSGGAAASNFGPFVMQVFQVPT